MGKADLHIHTTASDGRSTPSEIVRRAEDQNLKVIAITDHDTIAGLEEAREAASGIGLEVLSGAEVTVDFNGREAHLLTYCFDPKNPELTTMLHEHKKARVDRGEWIIGELSKEGLNLDMSEVKAEAAGSNIGRPHIATLMVKKGFVGSVEEAFIRYLSNQRLGDIPSEYYSHKEAIDVVKKAGGAVVIAHPGELYSRGELEQWVQCGIDGIEVVHPSHRYKLQKKMEKFAEDYRLLKTGGSDFHGGNRDYQKYFGVATISIRRVEALKRMTDKRKELLLS